MLEQESPQESHESATSYTHEGIIMQQTVQKVCRFECINKQCKTILLKISKSI